MNVGEGRLPGTNAMFQSYPGLPQRGPPVHASQGAHRPWRIASKEFGTGSVGEASIRKPIEDTNASQRSHQTIHRICVGADFPSQRVTIPWPIYKRIRQT